MREPDRSRGQASVPGRHAHAACDLHHRPGRGRAHQAGREPGGDGRPGCDAPWPRARRQPDGHGGSRRQRHPRAGLRPGMGQAHQSRADGEPLPPGAAADRIALRRRPEDVRRRDPHARCPGQGSPALGVPAGRRAQRPDEEHRPLGDRRLAVVRSKRKPDLLFVRLSRDSAVDATLPQWLETQLKSTLAEPGGCACRSPRKSPPGTCRRPRSWPMRCASAG